MKNITKKITVLRLILALVVMTSFPAQTQAAFVDFDSIGSWFKDKLTAIAWAEKLPETTGSELITVK
ncbi:MAG: hypothetical protein HY452_02760, partial [Parcubacteria group bacterium]|nr:hypothetical protein [Parcubacteria group bacterium]